MSAISAIGAAPADPADAALLHAAMAGEPPAIAALLARYQSDIRRFADRTCLADDADDAVQETLLIVSRRIGTFRQVARFTTWLFTIVLRECRRRLRRRTAHAPLDSLATAHDPAQPDRDDEYLRQALATALAGLASGSREVFLLCAVEHRPAAEVAKALGLTLPAVKSRLLRARSELRQALAPLAREFGIIP